MTQPQTSLAPPATSPAQPIASVRWDGGAPVIIDQRALPDTLVEWRLATVDDVVAAIEAAEPSAAGRVTCGGDPLPFPESVDSSSFTELVGGAVSRPLADGVAESVARFRARRG